jgi:hypothetical protein
VRRGYGIDRLRVYVMVTTVWRIPGMGSRARPVTVRHQQT